MPKEIWLVENPELDEDDDHRIIWSPDSDVYQECVRTKYIRDDRHEAALAVIEVMKAALQNIEKRPDLPNPDRDADWKNCQKWSSYEATQALTAIREFEGKK